jgi:four helix bundle protein
VDSGQFAVYSLQTVFQEVGMSQLPYVSNFRDLIVYQKSRQLAQAVFMLSKQFPKGEAFSLTDQIRRSSRSVGAQIAESWGKRRYKNHFISKLTDADAEQYETQHWLEVAVDCGYLTHDQSKQMINQCTEIGRLLGGMMSKADKFCNPNALREPLPDYFIDSSE